MLVVITLFFSLTLTAMGQIVEEEDDDWVDPYDMLNYDPGTKTMRKPAKPAHYPNGPTDRGESSQGSIKAEQTSCDRRVMDLRAEIEKQKRKVELVSQRPTCTPVFKRFLRRLLREVQRVGLPGDSADVLYDAKIKLSRQSITEIQTLLDGEESWITGALDYAVSQILVDLRPHDYEAWRWRAVAQEVERLFTEQKVAGSIPGPCKPTCRSILEHDTGPQAAPRMHC